AGALPALSARAPPAGRHGRPRRGRVRPVPGGKLDPRPLPGAARRRAAAGGCRDRHGRRCAVGGIHILRPGPGRARAGHAGNPAADRLGPAQRAPAPVPGLLDRRSRQDGLQAQVSPAGVLRWTQLAPTRPGPRRPMTTRPLRLLLLISAVLALAACVRVNVYGDPSQAHATMPDTLRVASYNVSLYSDEAGGLMRRLQAGDDGARRVAAVLQRVRPDIVLLNEFDYVADGSAADLFQRAYLGRAQPGGGQPLRYPYRYLAPVNTGVPSGLDLDGDGTVGGEGRARGNDAWGYGLHPGQYGMLLLSRYPIDAEAVR